jgi:hypothetical protein
MLRGPSRPHLQARPVVMVRAVFIAVLLLVGKRQPRNQHPGDALTEAARPVLSKPRSSRPPMIHRGASRSARERWTKSYAKLPLSFEANTGQTDKQVKFLSRRNGYTLFLTEDEALLSTRPEPAGGVKQLVRTTATLRMKLAGASTSALVTSTDELPGKANYFIGNDPKKWRTNIPTYAKVKYQDVYPGVDLIYYGNEGELEYDFVVAPGADPGLILLAIDDTEKVRQKAADEAIPKLKTENSKLNLLQSTGNQESAIDASLRIEADGDLIVNTKASKIRFHKPIAYQLAVDHEAQSTTHKRTPVDAHYVEIASKQVRFALGKFDHSRPLFIDPVVSYSTFLGGTGSTYGTAIAVDGSGNSYVTGSTDSLDFPTLNPYENTCQGCSSGRNTFITKLNAAGTALIYSTYLGGSFSVEAAGITVDASGNVYVTGITDSSDLPIVNALQTGLGGYLDAFVTKLDATGSSLLYSTYLGGSGGDYGFGVAADSAGNAYVAGQTFSSDFPATQGSFQGACAEGPFCMNGDGFVTKINTKAAGAASLVYSTFLGGDSQDEATAVAVDGTGNAYVAGYTQSTNFPTMNPFQPSCAGGCANGGDVFVAKLNPTGSALVYSTYLGGSDDELPAGSIATNLSTAIAVDSAGDAFVAGTTRSPDFPTTAGAFQTNYGGGSSDAFVTVFNSMGSALLYSTFIGGTGADAAYGIALDPSGNADVLGTTTSTDFPVAAPFQAACAGNCSVGDDFVATLNATGSGITFSTYLGGSSSEEGGGIAVDNSGNIYVTGFTASADFPTTRGAFRTVFAGTTMDAFVSKISLASIPSVYVNPASLGFSAQAVGTTSAAQTVTLHNVGSAPLTISSITPSGDFGQTNNCGVSLPGGAVCSIQVNFAPTVAGNRTGALTVADNASGSPRTLPFTGTATVAGAGLSRTSISFPLEMLGTTSSPQAMLLTNTGTASLLITSISMTGDFTQSNNCGSSLAPHARCIFSITFTPTAEKKRTGTLAIQDNAPNRQQTVNLSGSSSVIGAAPNLLSFTPQLVGTSSPPANVVITNGGKTNQTITRIATSGDFAQTNNCGNSLLAGATCIFQLTFTPTVSGMRNGNLSIYDSDVASPQLVAVSGIGWTPAPTATLSSTSLTFPLRLTGTSSPPVVVKLTNSGTSALYFNGIGASGDFTQTTSCGTQLAPQHSCNITVVFTPTTSGVRGGAVTISDNAPNSPQVIALSGTGTSVTLDRASLALAAPQLVGTPTALPVLTLTNVGNLALTINGISASGDYTQTNNCGSSVGAGQACAIRVVFTPAAAGPRNGSLQINDGDSASPQIVPLTGQGTFASLSATSLNFGNQLVNTPSAEQTVTLTNNGTTSLGIRSVIASGDYSQSNTCNAPLGPSGSCSISVTFNPSAVGVRVGFIAANALDAWSGETIALSGTGRSMASAVTLGPHVASLTSFQTLQFTSNVSVTWAVDGILGGNPTVGTIAPQGLYGPPTTSGHHAVTATSVMDSTQTDTAQVTVTNYPGVFTNRSDNMRSGLSPQEIALTTGNTNSSQFGKLFEQPVDGRVYAQPLYVANLNIPGNGTRNVVYVATEHDSVYAFDADHAGPPLWATSFINPAAGIIPVPSTDQAELGVEFGITGTPVIDRNSGTLYCVAYTSESGKSIYRLHALDIATGHERPGSPVAIHASVPGTGSGSAGGTVTFSLIQQKQRSGLLLSNGVVYVSWAVFGAENIPYHGWILGYDATTLQQVTAYNNTPNAQGGGFWGGGVGPAADTNGDIYIGSGNGTFDANSGGVDFGDSLTRLRPSGNILSVVDYFTPYNQAALNAADLDVGSCTPLLLPDQPAGPAHLLVAGGKEGRIYLIDRDNMGRYNASTDRVVQQLAPGVVGVIFGTPTFWQNFVYFLGASDVLKAFAFSNGQLSASPASASTGPVSGGRGATLAVSASGSENGILWLISWTSDQTNVELDAWDAADVSHKLYNSSQAGSRDQLGKGIRFSVPTIANGKVYVATQSSLAVFGLLPQ